MVSTELGMLTLSRLVQSSKASSPILVTPLGMVTEVRLEQPENAKIPTVVTPLGMVTEVRLEQRMNAKFPMLVTPLGIAKSFISSPFKNKWCAYDRGFELEELNATLHQAPKSVI